MRYSGDRLATRVSSEIIEDGITGFVVETEQDAIEAVKRLGDLDRRRVRSAFEHRFTARHMAQSYRRCFEQQLSTEKYLAISERSHLQTAIQVSESSGLMPEIDPAYARPSETPSLSEDG